jgi:hypothetical protein
MPSSTVSARVVPVFRIRNWASVATPGPIFPHRDDRLFRRARQRAGIAWRLADSLTLWQFLSIGLDEKTPDHVTISRTRG